MLVNYFLIGKDRSFFIKIIIESIYLVVNGRVGFY